MTASDLIGEFARDRLPGLIRDIVKEEMRELLKQIDADRGVWTCSWCGYKNVRLNAGLDYCSACGAETMTHFVAAGELRVRYTRNPSRSRPHLDCAAIAGCKSSTTVYQGPT